jgi:ABC-type sugar transport system ATPase subunit
LLLANDEILRITSICKSFGGVIALSNVSLELEKGEILSVIGENGAGKSTLMKIIAGALNADSGEIIFEGRPLKMNSPLDAVKAGISIVYQEPNIFPDMSVLENFYSGIELVNSGGALRWKAMFDEAKASLAKVGLAPDILHLAMSELTIGNQQLVLIARGLFRQCKALILDEPTSILSYAESEKLFEIIGALKKQGVSILYISHRIPEILRISDDIIVLRDGHVTGHLKPAETNEQQIIAVMSGRDVDQNIFRHRDFMQNEVILKVQSLEKQQVYGDINFELRPGQILGMYGLVGSGRSEIARAVFGELPAEKGRIVFKGRDVRGDTINDMMEKGIFYIPEDRGTQGLFFEHSICENMSAPFLDKFSGALGLLNEKEEKKMVQSSMERYTIKADRMEDAINSLSGGNQQKVLFCRWLLGSPHVLILDEPTRGIDVRTKNEIHQYIMELAVQNVAILLISSDLPEIMGLADDLLVMYKGTIKKQYSRAEMSEEGILKNALGL